MKPDRGTASVKKSCCYRLSVTFDFDDAGTSEPDQDT